MLQQEGLARGRSLQQPQDSTPSGLVSAMDPQTFSLATQDAHELIKLKTSCATVETNLDGALSWGCCRRACLPWLGCC